MGLGSWKTVMVLAPGGSLEWSATWPPQYSSYMSIELFCRMSSSIEEPREAHCVDVLLVLLHLMGVAGVKGGWGVRGPQAPMSIPLHSVPIYLSD